MILRVILRAIARARIIFPLSYLLSCRGDARRDNACNYDRIIARAVYNLHRARPVDRLRLTRDGWQTRQARDTRHTSFSFSKSTKTPSLGSEKMLCFYLNTSNHGLITIFMYSCCRESPPKPNSVDLNCRTTHHESTRSYIMVL